MKKVVKAPAVELSMRSLDPDGVRKVNAWFDYLEQWDEDEVVRSNAVPLPDRENVYVLRTTTGIWIFFRLAGDTITILDIAQQSAILLSGGTRNGDSSAVSVVPSSHKDE